MPQAIRHWTLQGQQYLQLHSWALEVTLGSHPLVSRFLKGAYQSHTPTSKRNHILDVSVVLKFLYPVDAITLKSLILKFLMLLLVTGQRGQTIHMLSLDRITFTESYREFHILHHTKTSKAGNESSNILIRAYNHDKKICPVATLFQYLKRTKNLLESRTETVH